MEKLYKAKVAVFGVGGVGGYAVEALARSGVGHFLLVDMDTVSLTNINRQIIALTGTVGRYKVDVMKERIAEINPDAYVDARCCFYLPETADQFDFSEYDYIVDCVDTVTAKLEIIMRAKAAGTPVISSMGAGNKLDPSKFRAADIYETSVCPLARVMRTECRKRGIKSLKVVYSEEAPVKAAAVPAEAVSAEAPTAGPEGAGGTSGRSTPGSTAFVPAAAGLLIASEVVKDLIR